MSPYLLAWDLCAAGPALSGEVLTLLIQFCSSPCLSAALVCPVIHVRPLLFVQLGAASPATVHRIVNMLHLLCYLFISNLGAASSAQKLLFTPSLWRPMQWFLCPVLVLAAAGLRYRVLLVPCPGHPSYSVSLAVSVVVGDTVLWQPSALHLVFCALCLSIVG